MAVDPAFFGGVILLGVQKRRSHADGSPAQGIHEVRRNGRRMESVRNCFAEQTVAHRDLEGLVGYLIQTGTADSRGSRVEDALRESGWERRRG